MPINESEMFWLKSLYKMCSEEEALSFYIGG